MEPIPPSDLPNGGSSMSDFQESMKLGKPNPIKKEALEVNHGAETAAASTVLKESSQTCSSKNVIKRQRGKVDLIRTDSSSVLSKTSEKQETSLVSTGAICDTGGGVQQRSGSDHVPERIFGVQSARALCAASGNRKHRAKMDSSDVLPHKCSFCTQSFINLSSLTVHIRIHTGEKPYKCPEEDCSKAFAQKGALTAHLRSHSGDRPYRCSICGNFYTTTSVLHVHMRIHTGVKPFSCPDCDKTFSDSSCLSKHKQVHTGARPFQCDRCPRSFGRGWHLNRHKRTHPPVQGLGDSSTQKTGVVDANAEI